MSYYINHFPERSAMKIMFLREAEGVYLFGQRRVILELDKNNKICVKLKGKFVDITQFIEESTPEELRKIRRNGDALANFNIGKMAAGKTAEVKIEAGKSVERK